MSESLDADAANLKRGYWRTDHDGLNRRRAPETATDTGITVESDDVIIAHLEDLGISTPLASILPRNFANAESTEDFVFEQMTSTIRTLGRQVGLTIDVLGPPDYRSIHEKDYEIVAPVLQFTRDFLVEGGATLTVAFLENLARHLVSSGSRKTGNVLSSNLS
jgi:hypothetical protein